jgi:hypothetical protein
MNEFILFYTGNLIHCSMNNLPEVATDWVRVRNYEVQEYFCVP